MIASLPMYDRPETQAANDRLWTLVRANSDDPLPPALTRGEDPWDHWQAPDLTLSQTCSLPYRARLHDKVALVGTPVHDLDCPPGFYYSVCLIRRNDTRKTFKEFAKARIAVNDPLSQSGWAAPQALANEQDFSLRDVLLTGAHHASAKAVASGQADIAAVDVVTWSLIKRFDEFSEDLMVLTQTPATPALPFITAPNRDASALRAALSRGIDALSAEDKDLLCLQGITDIPAETYLSLPIPDFPETPLSN